MTDTLEAANEGPIILRKKSMLPEEPHGGAWKVAYADFVTAMITSVQAVRQNREAMLLWFVILAAFTFVSFLSVFVGLLVVLPVLGHATWHLYRRMIAPVEAAET